MYRYDNGTYYVRDAQGNILAEYNATATYNTESKVVVYGGIRNEIAAPSPTRVWLNALNTGGYLQHDSVTAYFVGIGGTTVLYPAGYYLSSNPSLFQQFVQNSEYFPLALAKYSNANSQHPVADLLLWGMNKMMAPSLDASHVLSQVSHTLFTNGDANQRRHALEQLAQNVPDIYSGVLMENHIVLNSPSDSIAAANIMDNIATSPMGTSYYSGRLLNLYNQDPALITPWLQAATTDEVYMNGSWATSDGYVAMLQDAMQTYGFDAAQNEAAQNGLDVSGTGVYGAASWWTDAMSIVQSLTGGGLATLAYSSDPINYINYLIPMHGPAIIDTAMSWIPDGVVDVTGLAEGVGVTLTAVQTASLSNTPYLEDQRVSLGNHHMYGSSRLGIAQYQPYQYQYHWDYLYGMVDTFGLTKSRPWYSYALNGLMNAGSVSPYGNGLDSVAEGSHIIGQKQYELVNHLANVQETVTDKKYNKDLNGDSVRDEYRATPIMVYDYYPFGELMPGRSLDTGGLCITSTSYKEIPHYAWTNAGPMDGSGGGAAALQVAPWPASVTPYGSHGGVTSTGAGAGITYTIGGITSNTISFSLQVNYLSVGATVRVFRGTNTSITTGTQLTSFTVGSAGLFTTTVVAGGSPSSPATITMLMTQPSGSGTQSFSVDSIGYLTLTYTLASTLYTRCGNPNDKYEFGFNGKYKDNEVAGVGNSYDYGFRMFDPRIARFKSIDPLTSKYPWYTPYQFAGNKPILFIDIDGKEEGYPDIFSKVATAAKTAVATYQAIKATFTIANAIASKITPAQKQAADVTYQFVTGTGPESRFFGPDDPITRSLANSRLTEGAKQEFVKLNAQALMTGALTGDFSGVKQFKSHVSFGGPFAYSGPTNEYSAAAQMVGSADYTITLSDNHKFLNFHVEDIKGRYSLFYHGLGNKNEFFQDQTRHESKLLGNHGTLGNTYQTYDWSEQIVPDATPKNNEGAGAKKSGNAPQHPPTAALN